MRTSFVAFTGTPLLQQDKTTNKFSPIVRAYTMQRSVEDHTVAPLLYEERWPELAVNEKAINNWFARITGTLTEKQKSDLKKKFESKDAVHGTDNRIELIVPGDMSAAKVTSILGGAICSRCGRAASRSHR